MGTKNDHGKFDCYDKALIDEPMFVLLARDPHAPGLVKKWAREREAYIACGWRPESDREVVAEARQCAASMQAWRTANDGRWHNVQAAAPPMICETGPAPAEYDGGAVLCFVKERVICVYCRLHKSDPWPAKIEYEGHVFLPFGSPNAPSRYSTFRGESIRTAS